MAEAARPRTAREVNRNLVGRVSECDVDIGSVWGDGMGVTRTRGEGVVVSYIAVSRE